MGGGWEGSQGKERKKLKGEDVILTYSVLQQRSKHGSLLFCLQPSDNTAHYTWNVLSPSAHVETRSFRDWFKHFFEEAPLVSDSEGVISQNSYLAVGKDRQEEMADGKAD